MTVRWSLLFLLLAACRQRGEVPVAEPEPRVAPAATTAPTPATPARPGPSTEKEPVERASDDELKAEAREANPVSETVTLTLNVNPPVKAVVMWGAKKVGQVSTAKPSLQWERPRSSGPVDLEIRADGFLPHHTRLHTDRSDKVNVRLVRLADAPGVSGYRAQPANQGE